VLRGLGKRICQRSKRSIPSSQLLTYRTSAATTIIQPTPAVPPLSSSSVATGFYDPPPAARLDAAPPHLRDPWRRLTRDHLLCGSARWNAAALLTGGIGADRLNNGIGAGGHHPPCLRDWMPLLQGQSFECISYISILTQIGTIDKLNK
jgi:hypothetical protein